MIINTFTTHLYGKCKFNRQVSYSGSSMDIYICFSRKIRNSIIYDWLFLDYKYEKSMSLYYSLEYFSDIYFCLKSELIQQLLYSDHSITIQAAIFKMVIILDFRLFSNQPSCIIICDLEMLPSQNNQNFMNMNYQYLYYQPSYSSYQQNGNQDSALFEAENQEQIKLITQYIKNLRDPAKREEALNQLSKKRQTFPDLPVFLWYSVGTITILLQEIIDVYSQLSPPPNLKLVSSNRICLVVGLLQCLALHHQTRQQFLNAHIPLFLYPFLNTSTKTKIFENLRVTSLGVIGALVKQSDPTAINFLMQTEIVPLCLRIMKNGQALSKTVATFIIQKILCDQKGLSYICTTLQRFYAVSSVLNSMLKQLIDSNKQDHRLSKHIMKCYCRLSDSSQACSFLNKGLPDFLKNPPPNLLDEEGKKCYTTLIKNLNHESLPRY